MTTTGEQVTAAVEAYQQKLTVIGVRSVAISVGTMTGATLGVALLFNLLRPRNKHLFSRRLRFAASDTSPDWDPAGGWFRWVRPLLKTKEPELLDVLGLDAVVFLRFMRMATWLFVWIGTVTSASLLPINKIYNMRNVDPAQRNAMADLTIAQVRGNILWVHIGVSYLVNLMVMAAVWHNYKRVVTLRQKWFGSPAYLDHISSRTFTICRLAEEDRSDSSLQKLLTDLTLPHPAISVNVGRDVANLPELIERHDKLVCQLESALLKHLRGGKIGAKRPLKRIDGAKFLPCGGQKVDAITWLTDEIKQSEVEIRKTRAKLARRANTNYGFASMASVPFAHGDAKYLNENRRKVKKLVHGASIAPATHPKEIIWENLGLSEVEQDTKDVVGGLLLIFIFGFWTLPVLVISFLANLANISSFIPFLQSWQKNSPGSFSMVAGILPPVVSGFFAFLLPIIISKIIKLQGSTTKTELDRRLLAHYFDFTFVSQLIVFSCISVIFNLCVGVVVAVGQGQSLQNIFHNLSSLPTSISSTYIVESTYWLTWLPARGFAAVFELAQVIGLAVSLIKRRFVAIGGITPREARDFVKPKRFKYEILYANLLFMCCVGLAYAPLAPLVAAACMAILFLWQWVYKYQLMFVYITEFDSGGRQWPIVVDRLLVCLAFSNVLFSLTISLARNWIYMLVLVPTSCSLIVFRFLVHRRFKNRFLYYISRDAEKTAVIHTADSRKNRLAKRFEHPAFTQKLLIPLIDAKLAHLVPEVYGGKVRWTTSVRDEGFSGQPLETAQVDNGLLLAAVTDEQLQFHEGIDATHDSSDSSSSDTDSTHSSQHAAETRSAALQRARELMSKAEQSLKKMLPTHSSQGEKESGLIGKSK